MRALQTIPGLGVDLPELQQARALWQANRFDEALALFENAAERHPQAPGTVTFRTILHSTRSGGQCKRQGD